MSGFASNDGTHLLISARFDKTVREHKARDLGRALEALGVPICMVQTTGIGDEFGSQTMLGLSNMAAMIVFAFDDYGVKTNSPFCSYYELRFALEYKRPVLAIQMAATWPPPALLPDGRTSEPMGKAQNQMAFMGSYVREVCHGKPWNATALAATLRPQIYALMRKCGPKVAEIMDAAGTKVHAGLGGGDHGGGHGGVGECTFPYRRCEHFTAEDDKEEFRKKCSEALNPESEWPLLATTSKKEAIAKFIGIFEYVRTNYPDFPATKVRWKMHEVVHMMCIAGVDSLLPQIREAELLPVDGAEDDGEELCVISMDTRDIFESIEGDPDTVERFTLFVYLLTSSIMAPSIRES